ncbi:MAG: hypothetical protein MUE90_14860, partial [Thermoanaerobaculales bacterium]|nr:hypothetical protein [Thermoanaerobaculales bacterium]
GKGFHRVAWDLRYPSTTAVLAPEPAAARDEDSEDEGGGFMAPPGRYTVTLAKRVDGEVTALAGPLEFEVRRVLAGSLEGTAPADTAAFLQQVAALERAVSAADHGLGLAFERVAVLETALARSTSEPGTLDRELEALKQELYGLEEALSGSRTKRTLGQSQLPTVAGRLRVAASSDGQSDYGPTATHRRALAIASESFAALEPRLRELLDGELPALEARMEAAGVPWTPGRPLPELGAGREESKR